MTAVLITSAGRRVDLVEAFRCALDALGVDGRVLAADMRPDLAPAVHLADGGFALPPCTDPAFVPGLLELCRGEGVRLVVPTIDTELPILAAARAELEQAGVQVAVSAPEAITIAFDKVETHAWLVAQGLPTVQQTTPAEAEADPTRWPFPLLVKPRRGSRSLGVHVVEDAAQLAVFTREGERLVQTVARGVEYTIDLFVDRTGRCACAVPRLRIEVRDGIVSKARTVRCAPLEALARQIGQALPGAWGPLNVQVFWDAERQAAEVIEINARFGGGYPLSAHAGADMARWLLEDALGRTSSASNDWRDGVLLLRYDAPVYVDPA